MTMIGMPVLFYNLTGEMIYILDQRLNSQQIQTAKYKKVLGDIMGLMFASRFVDELFRPQPLYSQSVVRTMLDRLVHSSIMSLGKESMDKLFDLMMMVFKYQVEQCGCPRDLLMVTLNHLDQVSRFAPSSAVRRLVESSSSKFVQYYGGLSAGELQNVRYELLNFLQDYSVRVSIFLKDRLQKPSGSFLLFVDGPLPYGLRIPGEIRYFGERGEVISTTTYPHTEKVTPVCRPGSLEAGADHGTTLGLNIYPRMDNLADSADASLEAAPARAARSMPASMASDCRAAASLNLLAQMIGPSEPTQFRLNLFSSTAPRTPRADAAPTVGADRSIDPRLTQLMQQLSVQPTAAAADDADLLQLMEQALQ